MSAIKLNRFQMKEFTGWNSKLGRENHMAAIYQKAPQPATNMMVQLLALHRGKSLESELSKFPVKTFATDDDLVWDVEGGTRRNIPLHFAKDEAGTQVDLEHENVGIGGAPFYLTFTEEWFNDGETLYGNLNEEYPMRIMGDAVQEGPYATYKVVLMGCPQGIPSERLQAGELFSHGPAYVSREYNRKVGGQSIDYVLVLSYLVA